MCQDALDEAGHRKLAAVLHDTKHPWLLAYDDAPLVHDLYADFEVEIVNVNQLGKVKKGKSGESTQPEARIRSWRRLGAGAKAA